MAKQQTEKQKYILAIAKDIYKAAETTCKVTNHSKTWQQAMKEGKKQAELRRPNLFVESKKTTAKKPAAKTETAATEKTKSAKKVVVKPARKVVKSKKK